MLKQKYKDILTKMYKYESQFDTVFAVSEEEGMFLHEKVLELKPKRVLELGTWRGASAIYLASALEENGSGELVTVDLGRENGRMARENLAETGLDRLIEFKEADLIEFLPTYEVKFDLIFLDADKKPTFEYLNLILKNNVHSGSVVLVDDVIEMKDKMGDVDKYLSDLGINRLSWEIHDVGGGIAEIII